MKKICERCEKKFEVEPNPSGKTEGAMIIKKGVRHRTKLCDKCYYKSKKKYNSGRKGDKRFGKSSTKGIKQKINTGIQISLSKEARRLLSIRNDEIEKLYGIVERLSKENIKLKEEIQVMDYSLIADSGKLGGKDGE